MAWSKANLLSVICCLIWLCGSANGQGTKVDFVKDIKPIFESQCLACHNDDRDEGGFNITDTEALFDDWVYAEEGEDSPMVSDYIRSDDKDFMMPPSKESSNWSDGDPFGPLGTSDIELIVRWIDEGAVWPEGVKLEMPKEDPVDDASAGAESSESEEKEKPKRKRAKKANFWNAIGSLHPAAIHIPVGLLLAAGLFALLGLRGNFVMSDCAYYCLWLGAIGSVLACVSGWWFSPMEGQGTVTQFSDLMDQEQPIFWHRTSGLIVTLAALLLALFAAGARNRDPDDGFLWKLGLIVLAGAIGWVGHEGGKLTYGDDHYDDLNGSIEAITGWDANGDGVVAEWEEPKPEKTEEEPTTENGDGSSESSSESDESGESSNSGSSESE